MSKTRDKLSASDPKLTGAELEKVQGVVQRARERAAGPDMKLRMGTDGVLSISFAHANQDAASGLLMADLGTTSVAFMDGLVGQIASLGSHGNRVDECNSNFALSAVRAVQAIVGNVAHGGRGDDEV